MSRMMRVARSMRLPPRKRGEKWWNRLGEALLIACMPVLVMTAMLLLHRALYYAFQPAPCTCEMIKNHECAKP